jgi:hypothetical protein
METVCREHGMMNKDGRHFYKVTIQEVAVDSYVS